MPWPHATEYNEAIQNLRTTASDEELRHGEPVVGPSGVPRPFSGNFADVYKVHCPRTGNTWAVKCFTREVPGLRERYREISAHLEQARLPFMVDFQYVEPGIRAGGQWVPFLKMRWVEGQTLNQFVSESLDKPKTLKVLLQLWTRLAARLREAQVAHADLQHGNVLLVPAGDQGQLALRLIDYDGMYVPGLAGRKSGELGHPCYQHPQRLREGIYSLDVDRFSHLAIYCAVRSLMVGRWSLWKRFDNDDNLLFREADFRSPGDSEALRAAWSLADRDARTLAGRLALATQAPLAAVPLLSEVLSDQTAKPLSPAEERQVVALLNTGRPAVGKGLTIKPLSLSPIGQAGARPRPPVSERPGQTDAWWAAGDALPAVGGTGAASGEPGGQRAGLSSAPATSGAVAAKSADEAPTGIQALLAALEARFGLPPAASLTLAGLAALVMVFGLVFALSGTRPGSRKQEAQAPEDVSPAAPERREHRALDGHTAQVSSVAFSRDGTTLASGSYDGAVKLWNIATGQELRTLAGHGNNVHCVAFSPDGRTLASASDDGAVKLWDTQTGRELRISNAHGENVRCTAFSPDGRTVANDYNDHFYRRVEAGICLWDAATGRDQRRLTGHGGQVRSLAFSADGRTLASGSHDQTVKLWDVGTARELRTLTGHKSDVLSVAFAPDGRTLASASEDRTVKLWDVESGQELGTLTAQVRYVLSVAFSPDGRTLAGTSRDRSVRLWDAESGREVVVLAGHTREVCCAAFSSDGRTLATGGFDTTVRLWPVEPLGPLVEPPAPAPSGGSAPGPASAGPVVESP